MQIQKTKIDQIVNLHNETVVMLNKSLDNMFKLGGMLTEIKAELPHGEFTGWVEENLPFSMKTAQRYMKAYKCRDELSEAKNITEAYQMLSEPKNDTMSLFAGVPMDEREKIMCVEILMDMGHKSWHGFPDLHDLTTMIWGTVFGELVRIRPAGEEDRETIYFTAEQKMKALFAIDQLKRAGYKWIHKRDRPLTKEERKEMEQVEKRWYDNEVKAGTALPKPARLKELEHIECDYGMTRLPAGKADFDQWNDDRQQFFRKGDLTESGYIANIDAWREQIDDLDRIKAIIKRTPAA